MQSHRRQELQTRLPHRSRLQGYPDRKRVAEKNERGDRDLQGLLGSTAEGKGTSGDNKELLMLDNEKLIGEVEIFAKFFDENGPLL